MKYFILTLHILLSFAASAQTGDWAKKNGPIGGSILDIEYDALSGKIFVLGNSNKLYVSVDNGITWAKTGPPDEYINDIEITSSGTIFLVTSSELYVSTDQGVVFTKRTVNNSQFSNGLKIKRVSGTQFALLSYNTIYYSVNDGVNWTQGYTSTGFNNSFLAVNASGQIFILKDGRPYRSNDSGINFIEQSTGIPAGSAFSLTSNVAGTLIYCVTASNMYSSTNGTSWATIKGGNIVDASISGGSAPSYLIFSADGLGMYFIDNLNHKLYAKTLAGAASTWVSRATPFPSGTLVAACATVKDFPSSLPTTSTAFFGTPSGVFKTTTGGVTTIEANTGITEISPEIILSDDVGSLFINDYSLGILKSTNNGDTWSKITTVPSNVNHLSITTSASAMFALSGGLIYRSLDKGSTWPVLAPAPPVSFVWAMPAADDNKIFGLQSNYGPASSFYYSSNQGGSWVLVNVTGLPAGPDPTDFYIDEDDISFASPNLMLLQLYDYNTDIYEYYKINITYNGLNAITSAVASKITTLPFANLNKFVGANGKIYAYTTTGTPDQVSISSNGTSWATVSVPNGGNLLVAKNGYLFLADNNSRKIHISHDDGTTFTETSFTGSANLYSNDLIDVTIDPSGYAFLAFNRDNVYKSNKIVLVPTAPSGLTNAGISATGIALKWTDNSNNEDHFMIERSPNGTDFTNVGEVDQNDVCSTPGAIGFFVDKGLSASTAYTYRVTAVNDAGYSPSITLGPISTVASCAQNVPDNRSWSAVNSGESGFPIVTPKIVGIKHLGNGLYQISDAAITTLGVSTIIPATFFVNCTSTLLASSDDEDLKSNGAGTWNGTNILTLKWRACSVDEFETITLTLNATDPAPAAPTNVRALVINDTQVDVTWDAGFYDKTYVLERSISPSFSPLTAVGGTITYPVVKVLDSGPFVEGTTYYYRVRAINVNAISSPNSTTSTVVFRKPNFTVASTTVSSYVASTIGAYWADFDNDGLEDYLTVSYNSVTEEGTPTIFKNLGNGNFTQSFMTVDNTKYIFGSIIDYNNDGKQDIVFLVDESNQLDIYKGNGDLTFAKVAAGTLGDLSTLSSDDEISHASWGDINNDGLADLMLVINPSSGGNKIYLYKQNASHTFAKIPGGDLAIDVDEAPTAMWADYNNDGFQDILISNNDSPSGPVRLYRNNGNETFTKTTGIGIDAVNAFAVAWGDYNNDGNIDFFASNGTLNALYKNNGDGTFTKDVSTSISESAFVISAAWADYNNDGFLDLITTSFLGYPTRLFIRDAASPSSIIFTKIVTEKLTDPIIAHYGAATADYDNNGFLDVALSNFIQDSNGDITATNNNLFLNNNFANNKKWLKIKLTPANGNAAPIGAKIKVTTGATTQMRQIEAASSLVSHSSSIAHFGLGASTTVDNIQIIWPSGIIQNLGSKAANQTLVVPEDGAGPVINTYTPTLNATAGSTSAVSIDFNEATSAVATKKLNIYLSTNLAVPVKSIDVTTASKAGNKYTFTISPKLLSNTTYVVTIDAGSFKDVYGNNYSGLTANTWSFLTSEAPAVTSLSPANNITNVAVNAALEITFSENVTAIATKKIKVMDGTTTLIDLDVSTNGTVATNKYTLPAPVTKWPNNKTLQVVIDAGAFEDTDLNDFAGIITGTWSFQIIPAHTATTLLPAHNATAVAVNAALEITFGKNITSVAGKKIKVMDGTTAVVDLDVSTNGTVAANKYTLPAPTAKWPSNKTLQVIIDPGAFLDTDQNDFAGITSGNWTLTTAEAPDAIAPSITFDAATLATLQKNFSPVTVSVTITDNKSVASAIMHHRKITEKTYTPTNLVLNIATGKWEGQVSNTFADEAGFEYYFTAVDAAANQGRSPVGDGTNKTYLIYMSADTKIPSDRLGFGGKKANWKVAAIPFELASNNSVTTIFDELTSTALLNKIDYRLITYKDNTKWAEYPSDFSTITRGKGYFINIKNPIDIAVGNNLTVPPNSRGSLFEMNLQQGWNMIGNPYLTPISWSDVATLNNLTGTTADLKKFTSGQYASGATLQPFEGGFVFASSAVTISIPFTGQTTPGGRRAFEELGTDINADQWGVHLTLNQGDFKYELSSVGMAPDANISFDNYDDVTPPRFFDYLEVNFSHPEYFTKYFTRDVVPTMSEYIWNFTVDSNLPGEAKLTWSDLSLTAGSNQLFLLDVGRQKLVNMRESTYYSFVPDQSSRFKLYFGENLRIAPEKVSLGKAYPNPTSGYTTFTFSLPESGGLQQDVTLDVLDALGRPVTTLTQGKFAPGYHEVSWLGKDIANGLYSYRLTALGLAGRTVQFEKLVIK